MIERTRRSRRKITVSYVIFAMSLLGGCIVPPRDLKPSVLPEYELRFLSNIREGQLYAQGGRADLAEEEYHQALAENPNSVHAANDLGFVLLGQNRGREAIAFFRRALAISPGNLIARQNLAKALVQENDFESAKSEYLTILATHRERAQRVPGPAEVIPRDEQPLAALELGFVYRNLSLLSYLLGEEDDALCYSREALSQDTDAYQYATHMRMLLAMERASLAVTQGEQLISTYRAGIPSRVMLDYGISLYEVGKKGLADQAFLRVLARPDTEYRDRIGAKLAHVLISAGDKAEGEVESVYATFLEEEPQFCDDDATEELPDYWPRTFSLEMNLLVKTLCGDAIESVA